jgi:hypothetical protein
VKKQLEIRRKSMFVFDAVQSITGNVGRDAMVVLKVLVDELDRMGGYAKW